MDEMEQTRTFFNKKRKTAGRQTSPIHGFVYQLVTSRIPKPEVRFHAMDVGCSSGRYTKYLSRLFTRVWGVDYAELALQSAEQADNIEYVCLNVEKSGTKLGELFPKMDLVIAIGLLELVRDPAGLISNMYTTVRPGGQIFLVIPNKLSLNFILLRTIMWVGRACMGKNWFIYYNGITPRLLKKYLKNAGFVVQTEGSIIGLPVYIVERLPHSTQALFVKVDSVFKAIFRGGYYWISAVRNL